MALHADFPLFAFCQPERLHFEVLIGGIMADFRGLLSDLRRAEQHFEKQLVAIRAALASLEVEILATPFRPRRRRMSAEAKAKISAAQKKRWAKQKATE